MKHWTINLTNKFIWREGVTITDLEDNIICDVNMENPEYQKNANLIVNTPKMLEMLIKMEEAMSELTCLQDGWENEYVELKELIKEATTV